MSYRVTCPISCRAKVSAFRHLVGILSVTNLIFPNFSHFVLAPDIKKKIRVKMINAQGLDEAGIDGGGIFREFMNQLLKTGFDPSYGFFKATSEQLLYPNPQVFFNRDDLSE